MVLRFINGVCQDLNFAYAYLVDILVDSNDKEEHVVHLHHLLTQLNELGIIIKTIGIPLLWS